MITQIKAKITLNIDKAKLLHFCCYPHILQGKGSQVKNFWSFQLPKPRVRNSLAHGNFQLQCETITAPLEGFFSLSK